MTHRTHWPPASPLCKRTRKALEAHTRLPRVSSLERALQSHLEDCNECQRYALLSERTHQSLGERTALIQPPQDFARRIAQRVAAASTPDPLDTLGVAARNALVPLAGAALVLLILSWGLGRDASTSAFPTDNLVQWTLSEHLDAGSQETPRSTP